MRQNKFRFSVIGNTVMLALGLMLSAGAGAASKYKTLHTFKGKDGGFPIGNLIFDAAGNLYGATIVGGAYRKGTVFKLTPNSDGSWTESVLHSFCPVTHPHCADGATPSAQGLVFGSTGNLYGTTGWGGGGDSVGTVFKLTPQPDGTWTESVIHRFLRHPAANPYAGLTFDAAGNLYGTAFDGIQAGAVFKLAPRSDGSWAYSVLHVFRGKPAMNPLGGLVLDDAGNLYGTTDMCSSGCVGVVFEITP
jgi:uncharacterized repeat protein (TIGR03803 family)